MAISITVPRLGWSMEEGVFVEWLKRDGDRINRGDDLFVLESDKAAQNIESLDAGVLRITPDSPKAGDKVTVGQVVGYLVSENEETPALVAPRSVVAASAVEPAAGPAARRLARTLGVALAGVPGSGSGGRITETDVRRQSRADVPATVAAAVPPQPPISPRARRLARERGIDCSTLRGSGRNGRIRERDILAVTNAKVEGRLIPHTTIRRTIAARMVAGVTQAAPVTLTTKRDATNLVNVRDQFRAISAENAPSYGDLIVKLTAAALRQHPMLQAQWRDDALFVPDRVDVALAVDASDGVLAPVLRGVDGLTLREVADLTRELIRRAREGRLTAEQMRDATFTITNLGMFGVDGFTPIINLPQCAVLGVGRIVREPVVRDSAVVVRDMITLSLTFDHRVVDGAPAARFLDTLGNCLEQPVPWLMP